MPGDGWLRNPQDALKLADAMRPLRSRFKSRSLVSSENALNNRSGLSISDNEELLEFRTVGAMSDIGALPSAAMAVVVPDAPHTTCHSYPTPRCGLQGRTRPRFFPVVSTRYQPGPKI